MVVVLLAGCGATHAASSARSTSAAAAKLVSALRVDARAADTAALRKSDFPAGWKPRRQTSLTEGRCGVRNAAQAAAAQSESLSFAKGDAAAESTVYVYSTEATAEHWFDRLTGRAARRCMSAGIRAAQQAADGLRYRTVSAAALAMMPLGDQRAASRFIFLVTDPENGQSAVTPVDLELVRVDRGLEILLFADVLSPFPSNIAAHVAKHATARLQTELNG